jgi:hypothetical protein
LIHGNLKRSDLVTISVVNTEAQEEISFDWNRDFGAYVKARDKDLAIFVRKYREVRVLHD